jgi:hypothetical protein
VLVVDYGCYYLELCEVCLDLVVCVKVTGRMVWGIKFIFSLFEEDGLRGGEVITLLSEGLDLRCGCRRSSVHV